MMATNSAGLKADLKVAYSVVCSECCLVVDSVCSMAVCLASLWVDCWVAMTVARMERYLVAPRVAYSAQKLVGELEDYLAAHSVCSMAVWWVEMKVEQMAGY